MQQQDPRFNLANPEQVKTSGMVSRLEGWHETYIRLNPWAHGGLIDRAIQRLTRNASPVIAETIEKERRRELRPSRLTLIPKEQSSAAAGVQN